MREKFRRKYKFNEGKVDRILNTGKVRLSEGLEQGILVCPSHRHRFII